MEYLNHRTKLADEETAVISLRIRPASDGRNVVVNHPVIRACADDEQGTADDLLRLILPESSCQPLRVRREVAQLFGHGHDLRLARGQVVEAGARGGEADSGGDVGKVEAVGLRVRREEVLESQGGDDEVGNQPAVGEPPGGEMARELAAVGDVVGAGDRVKLVVVAGIESRVAEGEDSGDVMAGGGERVQEEEEDGKEQNSVLHG